MVTLPGAVRQRRRNKLRLYHGQNISLEHTSEGAGREPPQEPGVVVRTRRKPEPRDAPRTAGNNWLRFLSVLGGLNFLEAGDQLAPMAVRISCVVGRCPACFLEKISFPSANTSSTPPPARRNLTFSTPGCCSNSRFRLPAHRRMSAQRKQRLISIFMIAPRTSSMRVERIVAEIKK